MMYAERMKMILELISKVDLLGAISRMWQYGLYCGVPQLEVPVRKGTLVRAAQRTVSKVGIQILPGNRENIVITMDKIG